MVNIIKDKELRKITYNTAKDFDEKLEFIYKKLLDLQNGEKVNLGGKYDPFERRLGGTGGSIADEDWRHLRKVKCKYSY